MFVSRQLRIALLISLFWHLFWMFSISLVFLPISFKPKIYHSVAFVGSILREVHFVKGDEFAHKDHFTAIDDRYTEGFEKLPFVAEMESQNYFTEKPHASLTVERGLFNPDKFIDLDIPGKSLPSLASPALKKDISKLREIIYQPPFPEYPELAQQELRSRTVVFKMYILADGLVQEVINLQTSENPVVDTALARYIRRWRFAPSFNQEGQWQTIKIGLDFDGSTFLVSSCEQIHAQK